MLSFALLLVIMRSLAIGPFLHMYNGQPTPHSQNIAVDFLEIWFEMLRVPKGAKTTPCTHTHSCSCCAEISALLTRFVRIQQ